MMQKEMEEKEVIKIEGIDYMESEEFKEQMAKAKTTAARSLLLNTKTLIHASIHGDDLNIVAAGELNDLIFLSSRIIDRILELQKKARTQMEKES